MPRRGLVLVALLVGALVAAWRPVGVPGASTVSSRTSVSAALLRGTDHARSARVAASDIELRAAFPVGHRSPTWHRGTGRRSTRTHAPSILLPESGSFLAAHPFVRQRVASFVRSTRPLRRLGHTAVTPRAPPAIN